MKAETLFQAFQALFFKCYEMSERHLPYTENLKAMCELGESVWPDTFAAVRENHAWVNWQQQYNDPQRWFPQRISDDSLLQRIAIELLKNCSFHARDNWNLNIEGKELIGTLGLHQVAYTYYNRVSEETLHIGKQAGHLMTNVINEVQRHLTWICDNPNPMMADTE